MADIDYVNPVSIAGMGGSTLGNPENPNIGPVQGELAGLAWNRANQFLDMSQQSQLMKLAQQRQELGEFMGAAPYRQAANIAGLQQKGTESQLATGVAQGAIARLPEQNQILQMKQTNEFQQAYQALDENYRNHMANIWPSIENTLGPQGEVTDNTRLAWEAARQNWNRQVPPADQILPGSKNEYLMEPNRFSLASLKMVHDQVIQDREQQQKIGQFQEQGRQARLTQEQELTARIGMQKEELQARRDIAKDEIQGRIKVAGIEKNLNDTQKETIDSLSHKNAIMEGLDPKHTADTPEKQRQLEMDAEQYMSPRERSLLNPNLFQRIFAQFGMSFDQRSMLPYYDYWNRMAGTLGPITGGNYNPISPTTSLPGNTPAPQTQAGQLQEIKDPKDIDKIPVGSHFMYQGKRYIRNK